MRQVWQEEGWRSWRESEEQGEGGQRGEGGTRERGEQKGVPSPGGVGLVGAGRQTGGAVGWMRWELAWSTTCLPQQPPRQSAGLGSARAGAPHTKTYSMLKVLQTSSWVPPIRRSEESVLICCLLITSDPGLIPPKTFPESFQVAAGERCP